MTRHQSRTPHYPIAVGDGVERGLRLAEREIRREEGARAAAERQAARAAGPSTGSGPEPAEAKRAPQRARRSKKAAR
jgi:hypothetical protein